jgi:hypothetical protein
MTQKEAFNIVINALKAKVYDLNEIKNQEQDIYRKDIISNEIEGCKKAIGHLNNIMKDLKIK